MQYSDIPENSQITYNTLLVYFSLRNHPSLSIKADCLQSLKKHHHPSAATFDFSLYMHFDPITTFGRTAQNGPITSLAISKHGKPFAMEIDYFQRMGNQYLSHLSEQLCKRFEKI